MCGRGSSRPSAPSRLTPRSRSCRLYRRKVEVLSTRKEPALAEPAPATEVLSQSNVAVAADARLADAGSPEHEALLERLRVQPGWDALARRLQERLEALAL